MLIHCLLYALHNNTDYACPCRMSVQWTKQHQGNSILRPSINNTEQNTINCISLTKESKNDITENGVKI